MFRRRGVLGGLALFASVAAAMPADAAEQKLDPIVVEFIAAINGKNAKRLGDLLASDFVMPKRDANCSPQQSDRDCQIAAIERTLIATNAHLTVSTVKSEPEIVRANVSLTSDAIRAAGAERIAATKEFFIRNGKIQSLITTLRTEDPATAAYDKRSRS
jgi:hypothetical protein